MDRVIIRPHALRGEITPPPSKSAAHRAIICAALAKGASRIVPCPVSDDMDATCSAMRALGARIAERDDSMLIDGSDTLSIEKGDINCLESGSTLRFLIPVAAASGGNFTFYGQGRLPQRPLGPYLDCLPKAGVRCVTQGGLPLSVSGQLRPGKFHIPGNVSSQFITGLLLAAPLLAGDSRIVLTTPLESAGYIDMTISIMAKFGVVVSKTSDGYFIQGQQRYQPADVMVEGDWSQAAFWLAAGALGGSVACRGLDPASKQGDRAVKDILNDFGTEIIENDGCISTDARRLSGLTIDASQIPDLVPILAATACFAHGTTEIRNAARLRIKESDRLSSIAAGLRAFGAAIDELPDGLIIHGGIPLYGGKADGAGDHRIVMALSIAAAFSQNGGEISGCECISKSYPEFFRDFCSLGGEADVVHLG